MNINSVTSVSPATSSAPVATATPVYSASAIIPTSVSNTAAVAYTALETSLTDTELRKELSVITAQSMSEALEAYKKFAKASRLFLDMHKLAKDFEKKLIEDGKEGIVERAGKNGDYVFLRKAMSEVEPHMDEALRKEYNYCKDQIEKMCKEFKALCSELIPALEKQLLTFFFAAFGMTADNVIIASGLVEEQEFQGDSIVFERPTSAPMWMGFRRLWVLVESKGHDLLMINVDDNKTNFHSSMDGTSIGKLFIRTSDYRNYRWSTLELLEDAGISEILNPSLFWSFLNQAQEISRYAPRKKVEELLDELRFPRVLISMILTYHCQERIKIVCKHDHLTFPPIK